MTDTTKVTAKATEVTKEMTIKALVTNLMTEWCSAGGIATDLNNRYSYSIDDENDFTFEKDGFLRINVDPKMVFTFLSELEAIIEPDYISFDDDDCYIRKDEVWIVVYYL